MALLVIVCAPAATAQCISPRDTGAVGDGKADDTAALQAAIDNATAGFRGRTVCVPAGDYRITRTVLIADVMGFRLLGDGGATRFVWAGNDASPLLRLTSVQDAEFRGFQIVASDAQPLDVAVHVITGANTRLVSRHNTFVGVRVDGVTGGVRKGFQIGGGGVDANNDFHSFENVAVVNYSDVAYSLENTQIYGIVFRNCLFEAGVRGRVGVATSRSAGKGGSFAWLGGGGGGNEIADFSLGDPNNGAVAITQAIFESSARFLQTNGPSGASSLVVIDGVRWAGDRLASDGVAIDFRFPGPLSIRNSRIGDSGRALKISWTPGGAAEDGLFIFEGNVVKHAAQPSLFAGRPPTSAANNVISTSALPR